MARKSKYHHDFPLLVEGYARDGLADKQIWPKLGIGKESFYEYQRKYAEFADAIKRGRKPVDIEVENALLKRALGYEYEEKTTEVDVSTTTANGNTNTTTTPAKIKTVKKHIAPDVGAIAFWLKNRKSSNWRDRHEFEHTLKGSPEFFIGDEKIDQE